MVRVFMTSQLPGKKTFYEGISLFWCRLNFFPGKKLTWIFLQSIPAFAGVTQGFSGTGSTALENRGPESLRQLLAIRTPRSPSGQRGCGHRRFWPTLFDPQHDLPAFHPKESTLEALEKQPSPTTKCDTKDVKCQPRF